MSLPKISGNHDGQKQRVCQILDSAMLACVNDLKRIEKEKWKSSVTSKFFRISKNRKHSFCPDFLQETRAAKNCKENKKSDIWSKLLMEKNIVDAKPHFRSILVRNGKHSLFFLSHHCISLNLYCFKICFSLGLHNGEIKTFAKKLKIKKVWN